MTRTPFRHGLVVGKFYPPHAGHLYLIRTAARHCAQVTVAVLASQVESIPLADRVAWLRASAPDAHVRIVGEYDDVAVDYADPAIWQAHVDIMRQAIARADQQFGPAPEVDAVFSSEPYGDELARRFDAAPVCLDRSRALYPVSGTAVRADVPATWRLLPEAVRAGLALRVVVLGAESSGTSTLARALTETLRQRGGIWAATQYVAEYGREYSANLLALARARAPETRPQDLQWEEADFVHIAATQTAQENALAAHGSPVLVCDTDALATCIWHERYRGCASAPTLAQAAAMPARALYLLTDHADVPFEDDGLRDGEHLRDWMTTRFCAVLAAQAVPWVRVQGSPTARLRAALTAIDALLGSAWQFSAPLEQRNAGR